MADWSSLASLFGSFASGAVSSSGAHEANRTSLLMSRENRDWLTQMSNTEMQRRVKDLSAAGLNPMLGYSGGGASTPSAPLPQVQNTKEGLARGIGAGVSSALVAAQMRNVEAQTEKTNAEAALIKAEVPYSAQKAYTNSQMLQDSWSKLKAEAGSAMAKWNMDDMTKNQHKEALELAREYQRLVNAGEKAGIPEKEATAEFFKTVPAAKWFAIIKQVLGVPGLDKFIPGKK